MFLSNLKAASFAIIIAFSIGLTSDAQTKQSEIRGLDGEWIFVEDQPEGQNLRQSGPPMSAKFSMRVGDDAVFLNGHGSGHRDVRIALDGSITEVKDPKSISRYRGGWRDDFFEYEVEFERSGERGVGEIRTIKRKFRVTPKGLLVKVIVDSEAAKETIGLYRHAEDIEMPEPTEAVIADLKWLAGNWVGTRSSGSTNEERWSPPLGGAMLAVSRSVNTSGKMFAFEYLRIVERDKGLVYVAQPNGNTPTEFVLTEYSASRAVFDNPRHDYPKRIVYELLPDGGLSATVGFAKGGSPRRFEFKREGR